MSSVHAISVLFETVVVLFWCTVCACHQDDDRAPACCLALTGFLFYSMDVPYTDPVRRKGTSHTLKTLGLESSAPTPTLLPTR